MTHPHVCPICTKAFICAGTKCAAFNGVPHLRCAPLNKFARMTIEVPAKCPSCAHNDPPSALRPTIAHVGHVSEYLDSTGRVRVCRCPDCT